MGTMVAFVSAVSIGAHDDVHGIMGPVGSTVLIGWINDPGYMGLVDLTGPMVPMRAKDNEGRMREDPRIIRGRLSWGPPCTVLLQRVRRAHSHVYI